MSGVSGLAAGQRSLGELDEIHGAFPGVLHRMDRFQGGEPR
jgi:hypothetical protein